MRPLSCLSENTTVISLDASAAINLNATECAGELLACFRGRLVIPDIVFGELEDGIVKGRRDADLTKRLINEGLLQLVSLGTHGLGIFENLVAGAAASTLDDGEAATIAYAAEAGAIAVIDERKAIRISTERFPQVPLASTIDLFAHDEVHHVLGQARLADAVFKALTGARMRVLPHYVPWVVNLIGNERARGCSSLPRSVRM